MHVRVLAAVIKAPPAGATVSLGHASLLVTMKSLTGVVAVIGLLVCSTSAHSVSSCSTMSEVFRELVGTGSPTDLPNAPFAEKAGSTCGSPTELTCCSKSMKTSFNHLLRSMLNATKVRARQFYKLLKRQGQTKESNLANLQEKIRVILSSGSHGNCHSHIWSLLDGVLAIYNGKTNTTFPYIVSFYYHLAVRILEQIQPIASLSAQGAPELSGPDDFNFKLCIANWGHHRHFTQNNSNLMGIACCLDKFILLSKGIADALFALSRIIEDVRSSLLHSCPRCKEAFSENMFCHRCTGKPTIGSCPSLSTDFIYRCVPGLVSLNDSWNDALDTVDELISKTNSFPGICSCVSALRSSLEIGCPIISQTPVQHARREELSSTRSVIQTLVNDCSDPRLTYGAGKHNIRSFLMRFNIQYDRLSKVQTPTTERDDLMGSRYNLPSPSSCWGLESELDSEERFAASIRRRHNLSDIMLPQGGLFGDFFNLPNSSHGLLVSRDCKGQCWNGTNVIDVHQDIQRSWTNYDHSSRALANRASCKKTGDQNRETFRRTCCSHPEKAILEKLKSIANENRALLCQNQNHNSTAFCRECGSAMRSGDM
jgi:hypothetical protein